MSSMPFTTLIYEVRDGTAWITLNRPEALNAFNTKMYGEVKTAARLAQDDERVAVVVFTGTGRAFATGNDVNEMLSDLESEDPLAFYRFEDALPFDVIYNVTKPVIAAINGLCVGGGLLLALVCDLLIASRNARFGIPEAHIGLAGSLLPMIMLPRTTPDKIKFLAFTGELIDAARAEGMGFVTEVVDKELLLSRVSELSEKIQRTDPVARARYKQYVNRLLPQVARQSYFTLKTPELAQRFRSFVEKKDAKAKR